MMFDLDPKVIETAMRIYAEHVEIIKKTKEISSGHEITQHEIALHYKNVYDKSLEIARAILNQTCKDVENT